jgi:hypothetical protein
MAVQSTSLYGSRLEVLWLPNCGTLPSACCTSGTRAKPGPVHGHQVCCDQVLSCDAHSCQIQHRLRLALHLHVCGYGHVHEE